MKKMLFYLRPYRKRVFLATLGIAASTVCDLLLPSIMSEILNNGIYRSDFSYIAACCGVMLLVCLLGLGTLLLGLWNATKVTAGFCSDLRSAVFRKVSDMSFEEFGKMGTAALVTRTTHDVGTVSWVASMLAGTVITIPVLFFGGVFLAMRKDVTLALTMLAFLPVIFGIVMVIGKRVLPLWEKSDRYIDKQNDIMRERLRGIRVIRAFNAENKEHGRITAATRTMADYIIQGNVAMGLVTPAATFLLNLAAVLIVYIGGWKLETNSGLTGGDVFAVVQYVSLVAAGVINGAFSILMFPRAKVAAGRIGEVLDTQGMADPVARQELKLKGDIVFNHATFRYDGAAEPALQDVTMHIPAGEKVAVIGGTGSGKTTLVNLLLGFRMPTEGEIRLDGIPTARLSRRSMRDNMSCALQKATIYSGTVRDNVAMGKEDAADEEILSALETAQAMEFVSGYEEGIHHVIKQAGKNLSGGQKQRLSIARALLKDAPIYIFDDSFSALDFLTEANLRSALSRCIGGKTQIIITQRITSAMHCSLIFVLDGGKLVDSGSHEELLERCRVYREIYASQTGGSHEKE